MMYQWHDNHIVGAPKRVKAFFYNNLFIPKLRAEIAELEKENRGCQGSWNSKITRDIDYRRRAIKIAEDLIDDSVITDPGWRGSGR